MAFALVLAFGAFGGIWVTGEHALAIAAGVVLGALGVAAFLSVYVDRPLGRALTRIGRAMSGDPEPASVERAGSIAAP